MKITDEAVEAMGRHYEERIGVKPNASWMRELLEAAAPHMRHPPIPADKWAACYTLEGELVNEIEPTQ